MNNIKLILFERRAESSKIRLSDQIIAPKLVKTNLCCLLEINQFF